MLNSLFKESLPGLTSWAVPGEGVWMKGNGSGEEIQIGVFEPNKTLCGNPMSVCEEGFLGKGLQLLQKLIDSEESWISIDEIGFLETVCEPYCEKIRELLDKKHVVAVVRKQDIPFLTELRSREEAFVVDLDNPFGNMGCVIMASGLGKRFGGNKLMADFKGKPLITYVLDATEDMFKKRVVVTRHESIAELCHERNIEVVLHELPYRSDTVRLGVEALETLQAGENHETLSELDGYVFCPGDQPLIQRETIGKLLTTAKDRNDRIWRTCYEETMGSPVCFPMWAKQELLNLPEGKGGNWIIQNHLDKVSTIGVANQYELMDIDTPEDMEELSKITM